MNNIDITGEVLLNNNIILTGDVSLGTPLVLSGDITANIVLGKVKWGRIVGTLSDQTDLQNELAQITNNISTHVANKNNPHEVTKSQVGLSNVDNTSDANKPVSTATQVALNLKANANDVYNKSQVDSKDTTTLNSAKSYTDNHHDSTKVDKVTGKGLSTNDYTNADKSKVATAVQPADISDMATKTWTNAQGFLKEHQSLANYDTKAEVNAKDQEVKDWADGKFLTEHQSLSAYRTSANQDIIDNAIKADVDAIEELIPEQATSSNQLADKNFVNSSISTNTATFRGTSATGLTEQQFLAWANSLTKTNNDYVFWNTTDADGNVIYKRYKYNGTQWVYEYTLNNSSFTAAQWATVNSGMTSSDKTKLDGIEEGATKVEKTSDITNDGDGTNPFLTQHQSLANYSTTTQMNTAIANHHDSTKYDASNPSGYITSSAIVGKENTSNKVTSISSASTDTQYPSAKAVYDIVGNIEAALDAIRGA